MKLVHWPLTRGLRWGDWACRAPARPAQSLIAVPNVTAHPSTASVPITVLLYNGPLHCGFNMLFKGWIKIFNFYVSETQYTTVFHYKHDSRKKTNNDTIFHRANLNGCGGNALSAKWLRRQANVVDGVRTEIRQQVGVDGRRNGDVHATPLQRVVEIQLVGYDAVASTGWVVPTQLDGTFRHRNSLQVARLSRHCHSNVT